MRTAGSAKSSRLDFTTPHKAGCPRRRSRLEAGSTGLSGEPRSKATRSGPASVRVLPKPPRGRSGGPPASALDTRTPGGCTGPSPRSTDKIYSEWIKGLSDTRPGPIEVLGENTLVTGKVHGSDVTVTDGWGRGRADGLAGRRADGRTGRQADGLAGWRPPRRTDPPAAAEQCISNGRNRRLYVMSIFPHSEP